MGQLPNISPSIVEGAVVLPIKRDQEEKNKTPNADDDCIGKKFDHMTPDFLDRLQKRFPTYYDIYKVQRLNEMACMWKGKKFEPYTVRMLAMLYQENGRLNADIRGDEGLAIGISQEHICKRGLNLAYLNAGDGVEKFCYYKDGKHPAEQVEERFPEFSFDWVSQFYYFSAYISPLIDNGATPNDIVHIWNSLEVNRQKKVDRHEPFIRAVLQLD